MDVPCPPGVEPGFHRAENVFTCRSGNKCAVTLKVGVAIFAWTVGVNVGSVVVRLPDLDHRSTHRVSAFIKNTPAHPRNLADGWSNGVAKDD